MIIDAAELFAKGLVAKLEMVPGSRYVLIFKRGAILQDTLQKAQAVMHYRWGIETLALTVADSPAEAIHGIEIVSQESKGDA